MEQTIYITTDKGNNYMSRIDVPDICPICGTRIDAKFINGTRATGIHTGRHSITTTFLCTACDGLFHIDMDVNDKRSIYPQSVFCELNQDVMSSYPQFAEIYTQSLQAQTENLSQICGMGFRKAVEQLVKDYLLEEHPDEKAEILAEPLGRSIARIENPNIQALAKASTWLGNDQVHLVKKHPDYDIESMKKFIKSLVAYIELERACKEADAFIKRQ